MNIQVSMEWHEGEVLMRYAEVLLRQMTVVDNKNGLVDNMLKIELNELQKKLYVRLSTTPKNKKINVNLNSSTVTLIAMVDRHKFLFDYYDEPSFFILLGVLNNILTKVEKQVKKIVNEERIKQSI